MQKIIYQIRSIDGRIVWQRAYESPDDINAGLVYIDYCEMGRKPYEEMRKEYHLILIADGKEEILL